MITDSEGRVYLQGSVSGSTTVSAGNYHILDKWLVQSSGTLTIQSNVTLAFDPGAVMIIKGDLVVQGVEGEEVIFTSAAGYPQPGDWKGIQFQNSGNGDQISHAIIEFAIYGIYCRDDSNPVVLNSRITNNTYGIYNYYYTWNNGIPNPVVNYSEIFNNQQYNYYNDTDVYHWYTTALDARHNWWGSSDSLVIRQGIHDYYPKRVKILIGIYAKAKFRAFYSDQSHFL